MIWRLTLVCVLLLLPPATYLIGGWNAASTVRLYTKPGAARSLPFVAIGLPLVTLALLGLCMLSAENLAPQFRAFYLTWSPYHYAAQAYGLAVMYCYRSGCLLGASNKRLLWWVAFRRAYWARRTFPSKAFSKKR